jgi:hypothetical protein
MTTLPYLMRFLIFPASEYFGKTREWMAVELGLFLLLVTFDLEIAERSEISCRSSIRGKP